MAQPQKKTARKNPVNPMVPWYEVGTQSTAAEVAAWLFLDRVVDALRRLLWWLWWLPWLLWWLWWLLLPLWWLLLPLWWLLLLLLWLLLLLVLLPNLRAAAGAAVGDDWGRRRGLDVRDDRLERLCP